MSGPRGITGMTGMQGLRGITGPPRYGYQGVPYGVDNARITVVSPTSSPIYLTPQNFGTYFNITSNSSTYDRLTISFPFYNPTYGFGPTGTISSATGKTTYITYTTTTPVTDLGLRANAVIRIAGTLNNPTNVIPSGEVRILPSPTGPTGYNFSVAATTNTSTSSSGSATVRETTAVETTNEAYPTPEQSGYFWGFKNNNSLPMFITFSNGTVTNQGISGITSYYLAEGNGFVIMYSDTNGFIIL
jgi:hypothetical protein